MVRSTASPLKGPELRCHWHKAVPISSSLQGHVSSGLVIPLPCALWFSFSGAFHPPRHLYMALPECFQPRGEKETTGEAQTGHSWSGVRGMGWARFPKVPTTLNKEAEQENSKKSKRSEKWTAGFGRLQMKISAHKFRRETDTWDKGFG